MTMILGLKIRWRNFGKERSRLLVNGEIHHNVTEYLETGVQAYLLQHCFLFIYFILYIFILFYFYWTLIRFRLKQSHYTLQSNSGSDYFMSTYFNRFCTAAKVTHGLFFLGCQLCWCIPHSIQSCEPTAEATLERCPENFSSGKSLSAYRII